MASNNLLRDVDPLKPSYLPETVVDRENVVSQLSRFEPSSGRNLLLHGPRGTGKTTLAQHFMQFEDATTCYISCNRFTTQYQVLKQVYQVLTHEEIGTGHHTSDLQRKIEERTGHRPVVLILDEVDFLLQSDGDSLLYYLSRFENRENLSLVLISSNHSSLREQVEERTYSSLQTTRIGFEPYNGKTVYQLLKNRAEKALKPQSLHREALGYIASTTQNASQALHWLRTAAENTEERITEEDVASLKDQAYREYVDHLLQPFTEHHRLVYQAIEELDEESDVVNTGDVYKRYRELCQAYEEESLSNRRISDYLKQLELINLINVKYHYGGQKGKTREIKLKVLP
jgi:orc1/cdc6 family replication initiation protein